MSKQRIVFTFFVFCLVVIFFYTGCSKRKSRDNAPKNVQIVITYPTDKAEIEGIEHLVQGKVTNYSEGNIYVILHPLLTNLYWVQRPPSAINIDGTWQTLCYFGTENEGGGEFYELIAIVIDDRLKEGQTMSGLPQDSIAISPVVTVKRTE